MFSNACNKISGIYLVVLVLYKILQSNWIGSNILG